MHGGVGETIRLLRGADIWSKAEQKDKWKVGYLSLEERWPHPEKESGELEDTDACCPKVRVNGDRANWGQRWIGASLGKPL